MKDLRGKVAVITGAGSGFGREFSRLGAAQGMKLVLADIQEDALREAVAEARATGAEVEGLRVDVSRADDVQRLADLARHRFGAAHLLFNNAGVSGTGGYLWETNPGEWQWVIGVNLMGVVHGIRSFVPWMLEQGQPCHVVNTASAAGLLSAPLMGVYNVSKHAVVTLSETLFHDLRTRGAQVGVSVLCPAFVPTGISHSERNRPKELATQAPPTESQREARRRAEKAVSSGRLSAQQIAALTFDAVREDRFYVVTHRKILPLVELRLQDIIAGRNPTDPLSLMPEVAWKARKP